MGAFEQDVKICKIASSEIKAMVEKVHQLRCCSSFAVYNKTRDLFLIYRAN